MKNSLIKLGFVERICRKADFRCLVVVLRCLLKRGPDSAAKTRLSVETQEYYYLYTISKALFMRSEVVCKCIGGEGAGRNEEGKLRKACGP